MAYFDELLQRAITVRNNRAPASNTADLVGGVLVGIVTALQMLLDDKQDELTFDTAPTADSQNPVTSDGIYQALQAIDLSACEKIVNKVTSINAQSTDQQYPSAKLLYDQLALKANQATTYTKTEVDALIGALSTISFVVVQQLPTSDIQTNVIYLVPAAQPGQSNIYNEYIYVNNNWELIGSTAIDLSGYEQTVNKVTAISAQSTDVQYPSARCVWQLIVGINAALTNLDARVTALEQGPATIYYIKGTSSKSAGQTEQFIVTYIEAGITTVVTERPEVDAQGNWQITYANKKIYDLSSFALNNSTVLTITFNEADNFSECVAIGKSGVYGITRNATALTAITFGSKDDSKLTNIVNAFKGATHLTSIDLSGFTFAQVTDAKGGDATSGVFGGCVALTYVNMSNATLERVTQIDGFFGGCAALTSVDLGSATFAAATSAANMFNGCAALTSVDLGSATFAALTSAVQMFHQCAELTTITWSQNLNFGNLQYIADTNQYGMFNGCVKLLNASITALATQNFAKVKNAGTMFRNCAALTSVDLGSATFAALTSAANMFNGCAALTSVDLGSATFAALTSAANMFNGCAALTSVDLGSATFAAATSAANMFYGCAALTAIDLSAATFDAVTTINSMFFGCNNATTINLALAAFDKINNSLGVARYTNSLTTFIVPENATAIAATASSGNTALNFGEAPLNYASMLKIANWLRDFTGASAHNITFKTSAWNALTAAEQSNIDTILSGKNWTRVLA